MHVNNNPKLDSISICNVDGGACVFPQNPVLYNGSRDGYIRTCDVRLSGSNWPVMCLSQGKMASVTCLRELHDENYLLSSGLDGSVRPCITHRGPIVLISGTVTFVLAFVPFSENLLTGQERNCPLSRIDRRLYSAALN